MTHTHEIFELLENIEWIRDFMNDQIERPTFVTDEHLEYLDELRESGVTNMYGSSIYVEHEFGVGHDEAIKIVGYWMKTFTQRHPTPPMNPTPVTPERVASCELHILFHSIGLDDDGHGREYRNHFATDPDSKDGEMCQRLCDLGFMEDHGEQSMWGGMHCYCVTEAGKAFARSKAKPLPKLTRSQKRYRDFLDADCCMKFGEYIKRKIW